MIWTAVGVLAAVGMWMADRLNTQLNPVVPIEDNPVAVQDIQEMEEVEGSEVDTNTEDAES